MSESDETIEMKNEILTAIENLSKKFDNLENKFDNFKKESEIQFEAIRQGIVSNSAAFDRLEATVYNSRSDVANLRADVKELSEEVRLKSRETLVK